MQYFQVKVQSAQNESLAGVTFYSEHFQAVSDSAGLVYLPNRPNDTFEIKYLGYQTLQKSISEILEQGGILRLEIEEQIISEILVVGRNDALQNEMTQMVETITESNIQRTGAQTAADAIQQHAQVFVQKSQMGGGSPIIRGFEANKVLLVVDGVRLNNAIYRGGHLQNAITVSSFLLQQMEVIYGPGSLMYGSDALGGVVHFRTKDPKLSLSDKIQWNGQGTLRYATANQEKTANAQVSVGGSKWAALSSFTFTDFNDLRTGSRRKIYPDFGKRLWYVLNNGSQDEIINNENPNVQVGTAYGQWDFLQKLVHQPSQHNRYVLNIQHSSSTNIPRYDALLEILEDGSPSLAEWYYGPQTRWLASIKGQHTRATRWYDRLQWIVAHQRIEEDRMVRNFNDPLRVSNLEDVSIFSSNLDLTKTLIPSLNLQLEYGLEWIYNDLISRASLFDIYQNQVVSNPVPTRYPNGDNTWQSQGAYIIISKHQNSPALNYHAGIRYSATQIQVNYIPGDGFDWPQRFYDGIENKVRQWTGSIGLQYKDKRGWLINLSGSTAFRSPNIDDFAKFRISGPNASVPNPNLQPEQSRNIELNAQKEGKKSDYHWVLSGSLFYTDLRNVIIRDNYFLPNGEREIIISNRTFNVQANVNAERGLVRGISMQGKVTWNKIWQGRASFNWIRGRAIQANDQESPLAHIPPIYGMMEISYNPARRWSSQLVWRYNGRKPLSEYALGNSDNEEFATPEGALAWDTWNLFVQYEVGDSWSIHTGLENLLDLHYRPFSSGVSAAGRNLFVALHVTF